jgi:CHASE2 domain-containing sensor protein
MKTTTVLYQSPRLSVALYRQWLAHLATVRSGGILPPVPQSPPPPNLFRTITAAVAGMLCSTSAAFAIGMLVIPFVGPVAAFIPAAAASIAILFLFHRLARI